MSKFLTPTPAKPALLARVAQVCERRCADEAAYAGDATNPQCPLESTDSNPDGSLFPFQLLSTSPSRLRRMGPDRKSRGQAGLALCRPACGVWDVPTNSQCPLESTDSNPDSSLFPFQLRLSAGPSRLRRTRWYGMGTGKALAERVLPFADQLAVHGMYQRTHDVP